MEAAACTSIEMWGFTDAHTWIGTSTHPLPFDEHYNAKPAVTSMIDTFLNISSPSIYDS
jgi:GH35 family endo-1,4-beta-xylanase